MFGFSKKRAKLARLKVHLADAGHGARSPIRATKRLSSTNGELPAANSQSEEKFQEPPAAPDCSNSSLGNSENWMVLSISGDKPAPRSNHAAAVVGNNMVVVGGDSGNGLLDDVQVLNFDRFDWRKASSKLYLSPSSLPLKIPACKGHCLVSWGKKVLLIGGKTDPGSDRISVWSFDTETECWSLVESKGDIPVARSGHTVVRANSVLILFGGEDAKRRKMNDLYMFDLKSSTWLPLHCTGAGPSARSNHVAALYDDKVLFVFGGTSKSRILNDLYSLDFETMIWSRIRIRGFHPSARAGCCGVLCGTKWYISGGGSKKRRHVETLVFDVVKSEWSVVNTSPPSSITTNKGFSLALVQTKEKNFLVSFGGSKKELSNQVELLIIDGESSEGRRSTLNKVLGSTFFENRSLSSGSAAEPNNGASLHPIDSFGRQNLASALELHGSGRKSISESTLLDPHAASGNVSLRKQFSSEEEYNVIFSMTKSSEDEFSRSQATEQKRNQFDAGNQAKIDSDETSTIEYDSTDNHVSGNGQVDNDDSKQGALPAPSAYQYYEVKMVNLIRQNGVLVGQLAASLSSREVAEKKLSSAIKSRQETEKKLSDALKEVELLKERLAGVELSQEEATSLSNIVHSDNVRLEHDVAFLKAVLNDTEKELHSTRGVLAGEKARALQLQVEVYHLKQRLQSMENRAPTPRKPYS